MKAIQSEKKKYLLKMRRKKMSLILQGKVLKGE